MSNESSQIFVCPTSEVRLHSLNRKLTALSGAASYFWTPLYSVNGVELSSLEYLNKLDWTLDRWKTHFELLRNSFAMSGKKCQFCSNATQSERALPVYKYKKEYKIEGGSDQFETYFTLLSVAI